MSLSPPASSPSSVPPKPKKTLPMSALLKRPSALSSAKFLPLARTYARSLWRSALMAFCSTKRIETPESIDFADLREDLIHNLAAPSRQSVRPATERSAQPPTPAPTPASGAAPPESCPANPFQRSRNSGKSSCTRSIIPSSVPTQRECTHLHVLSHRQCWEYVASLRDVTDAHLNQTISAFTGDIVAMQPDRNRRRRRPNQKLI